MAEAQLQPDESSTISDGLLFRQQRGRNLNENVKGMSATLFPTFDLMLRRLLLIVEHILYN